jgi:UDP-glucose 4-epimerase
VTDRPRLRIVVTGASGFIGRRVCPRLSAHHEVFGVTRGSAAPHGYVPIRADLAAPVCIDEWPEHVDAVVHLAQSARHREFPEGAADMTAVNVLATASLVEYARRAGATVFVLASTGNVYTPGPAPVAEDDPVAPRTFYAATKAAAENLVRPFGEMMRVCTLRLFYPYGPGQENRLIPSLLERIGSGRPVSLAGSGDGMLLTPTYVDDIADVMAAAIVDSRFAGVFNVSAPDVISLRGIGEAIGSALGRRVTFENTGGSEPLPLLPSVDRLRTVYSLGRFTSFEMGLARMLRERSVAT